MRNLYQLSLFTLLIVLISCRGHIEKVSSEYIDLDKIMDGDTILLEKIPENLTSWIRYYGNADSTFKLTNFKCSGVILHLNELQVLDSLPGKNQELFELFSFSPDKKKYIDLFSYGNIVSKRDTSPNNQTIQFTLVDGEVDQQIVLGDVTGKRKELMFNGPSQFAETADWINDEQLLISMISSEENNLIAEVFLFDIKKKVFTNYRLDHNLTPTNIGISFFDFWQKKRNRNK